MNNFKPDREIKKILLGKNRYDEAIQYFTKTIEDGFHTGESYFHRAFVYFQKGEYRKSQADIDRARAFGYRVSEEYIDNLFMRSKIENI